MKKCLISFVFSVMMALLMGAQTRVVDPDGEPLVGAAVFDAKGTPIGIVDNNGMIPEVSPGMYPLSVRMLGFENATVDAGVEVVTMREKKYELGEMVVKPGEHPACRVVCYVRETSGMTNGVDTMCLEGQYMVDYVFKTDAKAKGVTTWKSPRLLNAVIDDRSSSGIKLDNTDRNLLTFYHIFGMYYYYKWPFPDEFKGKTSATKIEKSDKTGCEKRSYRLTPETFSVYRDALADEKDHTLSPNILKILGMTIDITEMWVKDTYRFNPDEVYDNYSLIASSWSMKTLGRGKLLHMLFPNNKNDIDIFSYVEIYPVDITYLTRDEAKELKKEKSPHYPLTIPAAAR